MIKEFWHCYEKLPCDADLVAVFVKDFSAHIPGLRYVPFAEASVSDVHDIVAADEAEAGQPMVMEWTKFIKKPGHISYLLVCNQGEQYDRIADILTAARFTRSDICF